MKTCSICKETKPLSDFAKQRARKDGLHQYCKHCNNELRKKYYHYNKKRINTLKSREYYQLKVDLQIIT